MPAKKIAIILFILMLAGLFRSRALLSLTQGAWLLFACIHYRQWQPAFTKDPLLWWSICPLILFLAGCWQQPFQSSNYDYLLTLCIYPIAAFTIRSLPSAIIQKQWIPAWAWATAISLLYPLVWYLLHIQGANAAYGMGQSLPTFMDTDHVRFGIFLCAGFLFTLVYGNPASIKSRLQTIALLLIIIFLSVRTAWVIVFIITIYFVLAQYPLNKTKNIIRTAGLLVLLICLVTACYYLFPTVQQKIAYTVYDWQQFQPGKYDAAYSDGARRAINYSAWQAVTHTGGSNTGWAAIPKTLQQYVVQYFPGAVLQYGWPFNQFLFWWMGSGWWGMLLFSAWLLYPLLWGWRHKNKGLVCWTAAITISCIAECTLSLQYGVWLHAWPLAILWGYQTTAAISANGNS